MLAENPAPFKALPCVASVYVFLPVSRRRPPFTAAARAALAFFFLTFFCFLGRFRWCPNASQAIENPVAPGGYDVTIIPEDPSSRSIRLVTEMMVLVGEGMGR